MPTNRQIRLEPDAPGVSIGDRLYRFPIRASDTGGRLAISLVQMPEDAQASSDRHTAEDLVICGLEGNVELAGSHWETTISAGDLAFIPRGLRVRVLPGGPSRLLVAYAPGTVQDAFVALGEIDGPSSGEIREELAIWGVTAIPDDPEADAHLEPTIVRADEGERYWLAGDEYTIKLDGEATGGRFCVVHFRIPAGAGPLPHTHSLDEEIFHILTGHASFWSEAGVLEGSEGDTILLPRGVPHAFRNRSQHETEFLSFFSPAGFDQFLRSAAQPAVEGGTPPPPDDAERVRLMNAAGAYGLTVHTDIEW